MKVIYKPGIKLASLYHCYSHLLPAVISLLEMPFVRDKSIPCNYLSVVQVLNFFNTYVCNVFQHLYDFVCSLCVAKQKVLILEIFFYTVNLISVCMLWNNG